MVLDKYFGRDVYTMKGDFVMADGNKLKALESALAQLEKQYGKGKKVFELH